MCNDNAEPILLSQGHDFLKIVATSRAKSGDATNYDCFILTATKHSAIDLTCDPGLMIGLTRDLIDKFGYVASIFLLRDECQHMPYSELALSFK